MSGSVGIAYYCMLFAKKELGCSRGRGGRKYLHVLFSEVFSGLETLIVVMIVGG